MAFNPKYTITPKINKALVEIERVRGFLDAVKLKDDWIADMQQKALILESHHSTHIEGTALSLEQAKSITMSSIPGLVRLFTLRPGLWMSLISCGSFLCIFIPLLTAMAARPGLFQRSSSIRPATIRFFLFRDTTKPSARWTPPLRRRSVTGPGRLKNSRLFSVDT